MFHPNTEAILATPAYHRLVRARRALALCLSAIMLMTYFGFILTIAFKPAMLAVPLAAGSVVTWGIPIGLGLIVLAVLLTGIYTWVSNTIFDALADPLHDVLHPHHPQAKKK